MDNSKQELIDLRVEIELWREFIKEENVVELARDFLQTPMTSERESRVSIGVGSLIDDLDKEQKHRLFEESKDQLLGILTD